MSEQIWVPIAIAFFGNSVAIVVVILSNRSALQRESSRLNHERERWARDDAWRVSELQRDYYVEFYGELRRTSLAIHNAGYKIGPGLTTDWNLPAYEALIRLRIFAGPAAYVAANAAYDSLWLWGVSGEGGYESDEEVAFDQALTAYVQEVRADIGLPRDPGVEP